MENTLNYTGPGVQDKYLLVKLEAGFPPASKKSRKAHDAIVSDMIAQGADPATAEAMATGSQTLFPDGELKAIKSPYYSFNTWLDRVCVRWLGGKGAPKLVSIHMLDKIEQRFAEAQLVILPLIEKFVADYGRLLDSLEARTGQYFDRSDYPTVEQIADRFRFSLSFTPIGDPRQFDLGVVSEAQKDRMTEALNESAKAASKEYARTIHTALAGDSQNPGLIRQLLGGRGDNGKFVRFADSNVTNLMDMLEADLNASGCPELAAALRDVEHAAKLARDAAIHKSDKAIRTTAANAASRAANKLAGLM